MFVLCAGYFNGRVIKYCKETDNYEIVYDGVSCARRALQVRESNLLNSSFCNNVEKIHALALVCADNDQEVLDYEAMRKIVVRQGHGTSETGAGHDVKAACASPPSAVASAAQASPPRERMANNDAPSGAESTSPRLVPFGM